MNDPTHLSRRTALQLSAYGAAALSLGNIGCASKKNVEREPAPDWLQKLAQSETGGRTTSPG